MSSNCNCAVQIGCEASWYCPVHGRVVKKPATDPGAFRPVISDPVPTKGELWPPIGLDGNESCPECGTVVVRAGSGWKCLNCGHTEGLT